jgi:hypothetical protein|tara:strand:- start:3208 stop:3450 length:243 start_codon:yes stop_codon:yes gene_type:complete
VRFISPPLTPRINRLPMYVSAHRVRLSWPITFSTRRFFSSTSSLLQHMFPQLSFNRGSLAIAANMIVSRTVAPPKKQSCC